MPPCTEPFVGGAFRVCKAFVSLQRMPLWDALPPLAATAGPLAVLLGVYEEALADLGMAYGI